MPATTITSGNLTFSSTAQRITGDMSTTTFANRLAFQTSGTNLVTSISALPNGTATGSNANFYNNSDPTNASLLLVGANLSETIINSTIRGTGTYLPMTFYTGGSERVRIDTSGNVGIGTNSPVSQLHLVSASDSGLTIYKSAVGAGNVRVVSQGGGSALAFGSDQLIGTTERMRIDSSGNVGIGTSSPASKLDVSGTIRDSAGNVRAIPRTGSAKTGSYTLATTDVGQFVEVGSGGSVTVPNSTFATGDVVSIFNNTSGNVTLTMSITTAYIGGTDADKNTITLATRGVATILFISGTVCVVNGNVS
jgi:hypothetical protein